VSALADNVLTFEHLSSAARTVDPARLQAAIREFRQATAYQPQQILQLLPAVWTDMLIITLALATIVIEDLGGVAWLEEISPGPADARARHEAAFQD
jgi:hypothetical protein